jgi:hypothetical protein
VVGKPFRKSSGERVKTMMTLVDQALSAQAGQCRRMAHVLTLTKKMLGLAEEGEWDQVADMEVLRRDDLRACFSDTVPAADTELMAEAMAALLSLNEELMAKLRVARSEVLAQGRERMHKRSAVDSYQEIGASH